MEDVRTVAGQTYTTSYTYNAFNQLLSSNATCTGTGCPARVVTGFAYDNNGNLLTETVGTTTVRGYTWDADNRLRSLTTPGGLHQYQYDANGLRTQQVTPTGVTKYVLDGASVLEELDAGNQQKAHYLSNPQGIDDMFAFTQGGNTYFPLADALGSLYAVSNSSGQVTRSYSYDVYGERNNVSGASPELAFGFTGREHDASGLNYNRDRYLDVRAGRWHQPDRLGFVDGPSVYQYVRGGPSQRRDPSGFFEIGNSSFVKTMLEAKFLQMRPLVDAGRASACWLASELVEAAGLFADRPAAASWALLGHGFNKRLTVLPPNGSTGFREQFRASGGSDNVHHALGTLGAIMLGWPISAAVVIDNDLIQLIWRSRNSDDRTGEIHDVLLDLTNEIIAPAVIVRYRFGDAEGAGMIANTAWCASNCP
ncbi:MAG: RHS repeat domain-containing protein [Myxococcaceae bacterium]